METTHIESRETDAFHALLKESKDQFIVLDMPSTGNSCIPASLAYAATFHPGAKWTSALNQAQSLLQIRTALGKLVEKDFNLRGRAIPS